MTQYQHELKKTYRHIVGDVFTPAERKQFFRSRSNDCRREELVKFIAQLPKARAKELGAMLPVKSTGMKIVEKIITKAIAVAVAPKLILERWGVKLGEKKCGAAMRSILIGPEERVNRLLQEVSPA